MSLLDVLVIILVFGLTAYVGYRSSKNVKNIDDFTLAGSRLGKIQAGFSMAATEFGGSSLIGTMAFCYGVGLSGAWWSWSAVPALVMLGVFFAGRIKLPGMVTITEFFERRYDKKTRTFSTILHLIETSLQISTQFLVGATALHGILGIPKVFSIILTIVFVMLYTVGGGLIAVVNTDMLQFVVVVISALVAAPIAVYSAGGFSNMQSILPPEFFTFNQVDIATIVSWCLFSSFVYATNQHYIQRLLASKDKSTARFSFIFTGVCYIFYGLLIAIIGVCIAALIPGLSDANMGYAMLIKNYMPAGIRGVILGGLFAASMSTADSILLSASTLFVNDLYIPFKNKRAQKVNELKVIKITTVVVSVLAGIISIFSENIISLMYLSGLFYSTAVFFPLIIGLYCKRINAQGAFAAIASTVAIGIFSELFLAGKAPGILGIPSNIMACSCGFIILVVVSLLTKAPDKEKSEFLEG